MKPKLLTKSIAGIWLAAVLAFPFLGVSAFAAQFAEGPWMTKSAGVITYASNAKVNGLNNTAYGIQAIKATNAIMPKGYGGAVARIYISGGYLMQTSALKYNQFDTALNSEFQVVAPCSNTMYHEAYSWGEAYAYDSSSSQYVKFIPGASPLVSTRQ